MVTTNQKPTTIDTQKRERIPNITLKKIIKPQEKKLKEEERTEQNCKNNQRTSNKMSITLSIITLNVNRLNAPIKRYRMVEWIKKQDPSICCYKRPTSDLGTHTE